MARPVLIALIVVAGLMAAMISSANAASQTGLERAKAAVEQRSKAPNKNLPIPKLPKVPKSSTLTYLKCGLPICEAYLVGARRAAKALGLRLKTLDAGNTPDSQTKAWDQAVLDSPSAVVEVGFQLSLFSKQIAALKREGIPIISGGDEGNVTTNTQPPSLFRTIGAYEANYAIAKSNGKAKILFVSTPAIPLVGRIADGYAAEVKKNCSACTLDVLNVQPQDVGRVIPGQIVSHLQKNPGVKWISLGFGDMIAGVPEALRGAGITGVHIVTGAGGKLNWGYIRSGTQDVDLASDVVLAGWWMVDRAVRAIGKKPIKKAPPWSGQFLTKSKLTFDLNKGWNAVPGYEKQFVKKWAGK